MDGEALKVKVMMNWVQIPLKIT